MSNLNVAVLGSPEYAGRLGKKGTVSDITLFNFKRGEDTLTLIEPTRYPDRLSSLFFAVSLAKKAILVVDSLTPQFGEMVLMLQAAGVEEGFLILRQFISPQQVQALVKGTVVEGYALFEDNPVALRELLLKKATELTTGAPVSGEAGEVCTIPVDHFFPVKGIGVVVLGCVSRGTVQRHAALTVLPSGHSVLVRSIQKHDEEVEWAEPGDRVGLALKNIELEDLDRGDVLTNDTSLSTTSSLSAQVSLFPYWQQPLKAGIVVHLGYWMQFLPARVLSVEPGNSPLTPHIVLAVEKPIVHVAGGTATLCSLDGKKLRVMGTVALPKYRVIDKTPI
jgi:selenocysteine-specific translation elongation factor